MEDLKAKLEKPLVEAEDRDLIASLASDATKRETFKKPSSQLRKAASDIDEVIARKTAAGDT